ncbi:16S rRNA (guanine(527)-N(7))-methyltransferase RsmG [Rhodobacter capsulatus]|uniref:Ribosomal RNA small subunit methyltransferase G n=1 Tax=Rhodobacter capsulatus TaxID=1061 RepID=A0A4U1K2W7_RHOCA|nr:16S rRNA (guanine(527)-N(7))-methyltransferase RsmG [Rhodobacter capsulatus]TKD26194.1 16S rRNA (guanine(527)-N(7))-methyltransferase RsmG [Rhodobacter capsulatus]
MTGPEAFADLVDVSRETIERLERLEALLKKWNPAINLVSPRTLAEIWTRHFLDSAQILQSVAQAPQHWADLGSGGGFPGLVVGVLAKERFPDMRLTLVESDKRKAAFLLNSVRDLGLFAEVADRRIESLDPLAADVLSARALAPLEMLLSYAERHLSPAGIALFPKGNRWREEVAQAQQKWSFDFEPKPSATDPESVVLKIKGLHRA